MSSAPNGTTDAPTRDSIPSGTEADDPIPGIAKRLAERLRLALFPGIKAFEKKTLATFTWEDQGKRHSTSVVLQDVKDPRAGAATVNFTLVWQAKGGKEVEVPIKAAFNVQIQRGRAALLLQIYVHDGSRTVTLARSENIAKWDAGEKNVVFYPYPSSAIGVERVGQVWFPKDPSQKAISREIGFAGSSTQTILTPFWPHFNESLGWVVELPPLPAPLGEAMPKDVPEGWGRTVLSIAIWATLVQPFQQAESGQSEAVVDPTVFGLPPVAKYWPQRAVNLDPNRVYAELSKTLLLPWHLVAAACASLNAGKHVIFTGPPGCGKSKLAIALAQIVRNAEPVISTASPAWTAGDLVGRYLPRRDGKGLEFKPGFFLRAVEANRCLVIDEFNRANIDQCFGELFAVFAGDPVELPFEQAIEEAASAVALPTSTGRDDGSNQDGAGLSGVSAGEATPVAREPRYATVRILPTIYTRRQGTRPESEGVVYRDYKVSPEFRLIGTMNDADRAQLHQLSFALLRRFDILRVEAPAPDRVKEFVAERVGKIADSIDKTAYQFEGQGTRELLNRLRVDYLEPLFANILPKQDPAGVPFADLVVERVIGLATVEDILRFLAEGLRCPSEGEKVQTSGLKDAGLAAAVSYLAMGLVLSVFPQLDALDRARRWVAIAHVIKVFQRDGKGCPFVHIEGKRDEKLGRVSYHLVKPSARSFRPKDIDKNNEISTAEYLIGELSLQYQDIGDEVWNDLVRGA
jgi:energy-coupling factor transporter ATP-binding protein EcfA2